MNGKIYLQKAGRKCTQGAWEVCMYTRGGWKLFTRDGEKSRQDVREIWPEEGGENKKTFLKNIQNMLGKYVNN